MQKGFEVRPRMVKKVECINENRDILRVVIHIKLGFLNTLGFLLFSIIMLLAGLFITILLLLGALSLKLFQMPIKDILMLLIAAILTDFVGGMALYQWLRYNFGKEIITINNSDKCLQYRQLVLGIGKTRVFDYCNITKIIGETEFGRNPDYHCCLIHQDKKFRFGMVDNIIEGKNLARRINDFITK